MEKKQEMEELVKLLNTANQSYYDENLEIMTNLDYDKKYDRLLALEQELKIVLPDSPTLSVAYETVANLPKEVHVSPMLSLDKTKDVEELKDFAGEHKCLMSWKLDGITIVLTYKAGKLHKAVTRGSGEIGEVVTGNARTFINLPKEIPCLDEIVVRGEALISYGDFNKINESLPDLDAKYKNPRNLCSGSVRQLNSKITAERKVRFVAFALVSEPRSQKAMTSGEKRQLWLKQQGFEIAEYKLVTRYDMENKVEEFREKVATYDYPSDGLVLTYDDIEYGISLGTTSKFPRDAIAFKWQDETKSTVLREIEWSTSRTGLINPIAIFDPVELEGTRVSRASVHNVSIVKELELGIGDEILVYKANMIIPQIAQNLTASGSIEIPQLCPICMGSAEIHNDKGVETLNCTNPECPARSVKTLALFVSRDGINVEGLSETTIGKLVEKGIIKEKVDFFKLGEHREEIEAMEGFGEKSYKRMVEAVKKAKKTSPARLLYGLGIPNIGVANAKMISKHCHDDFSKIQGLNSEELLGIDGIGQVMARDFVQYFQNNKHRVDIKNLMQYIEFQEIEASTSNALDGKIFVITGSLERFQGRSNLKELIEKAGGKVGSGVTAKTDYLINNNKESNSSKNKKAKELNISIISEDEFIEKFGIHE